ncbi:MAG: hypothetical protein QM528_06180 [Phycisphaerales bacterium]|nr:hypothetical protein [Phycisphaerales bacterium]
MQYPSEILPQHTYQLISPEKIVDFFLIRHVDNQTHDTIIDQTTKLVKPEFIANPTAHARDLSTSLLGVFTVNHTKIQLTDKGKDEYAVAWLSNEAVNPLLFKIHFDIYENRTYWFIKVSNINNQTVQYTNPENCETLHITCQIEHTPMKWNFWHFSIRWQFKDGRYWHTMSKKDIEKYSRKIGHETKSIISKFAQVLEPDFKIIPTDIYTNG